MLKQPSSNDIRVVPEFLNCVYHMSSNMKQSTIQNCATLEFEMIKPNNAIQLLLFCIYIRYAGLT